MEHDEIGAHVSIAGGVQNAPVRAGERNTHVLQIFTKMASRWAEPDLSAEAAARFRSACQEHGIRFTAAHDSYLINLGTEDPALFARSCDSFRKELERCALLGIDALVSHPGNATGGNVEQALVQNAEAVACALRDVQAATLVLFETTAGAGSSLGASFEQLARLIELIPQDVRPRVGVCVDTCHIYAAGYDIVNRYDDVFHSFDSLIGLDRLRMFHLNDSAGALGSRRDRHAHIGAGALGPEPFRRLVNDRRFTQVPKLIETPKDDDALTADLMNLATLRGYRAKR